MNCLIYLRVSTKEQAEGGYSIPAQRDACVKYIRDKDWTLVDEYADRGESARTQDRPQLQEMLHRLKEDGAIDTIVVHKLDRLARNLEDHAAIRAILRKYKVQFVSVTENLEDSASGKLVEGILASIAEFYSANLSSEVKKGMRQMVKQGGWPHQAPIGYKNVRDGNDKAKIELEKDQAMLIKEAFMLYSTGNHSIRELHKMMEKKGLKRNGKPIVPAYMFNILRNPFYYGKTVWQGEEFQGSHPPIISKDLFNKVQEVFTIRDKAGERKRKHPHYLKGTLYCGQCKSKLSVQLAKGQYPYFYCLGQHKKIAKCGQSYTAVPIIEKQIIKLYQDIELPPELVEVLTSRFEKELLERESYNVRKKEFLTRSLDKLIDERDKMLRAYYAEAISLELLKKEQKRIGDEMVNLEGELQTVSARFDIYAATIKTAIILTANCGYAYAKASPKVKRMFNQAFFKKIYIKNKKISGVEHTEPFDLLFNFGKSSNNDTVVGLDRLERSTSPLSGVRSNQLSYRPTTGNYSTWAGD